MGGSSAYGRTHVSNLDAARLEREALLKAAALLERARTHPEDAAALADALDYTVELWTVVQADVADAKNTLAPETKEQILSIGLFMDKAVRQLIKARDGEILRAMIEINRNLAGTDR